MSVDVWVMAGVTLLFLVFARTGSHFSRLEGGVFLAGYGLFPGLLVYRSMT